VLSVFQDSLYLLRGNARKPLDEFLNRGYAFNVLEESFHWHTGTLEQPGSSLAKSLIQWRSQPDSNRCTGLERAMS
jgi:hypothetical protein